MNERFTYEILWDMANVAAMDNDSMAYRIEVVKEAFEAEGYHWKELDIKYLAYLAGKDHTESHLPKDPKLLPAIVHRECGIDIRTLRYI